MVTPAALSFMKTKNIWEDALDAGTVRLKEPAQLEVGIPVEALRRISDAGGLICSVADHGVVTRIEGGRVHITWERTKIQSSIAEQSWQKYTRIIDKDVYPLGSRVKASTDIVVGGDDAPLAVKKGMPGTVLETDNAASKDGRWRIKWDRREDGKDKPIIMHRSDLEPGEPLPGPELTSSTPVRFYLASGESLDISLQGVQTVSDVKSRISESLGLDHYEFSVSLILGCEVLEDHALCKDICQVHTGNIDIMVVLRQLGSNCLEGFRYNDKPVSKIVQCHGKNLRQGKLQGTRGDLFRVYYSDGETELVPGGTLLPNSNGFFI